MRNCPKIPLRTILGSKELEGVGATTPLWQIAYILLSPFEFSVLFPSSQSEATAARSASYFQKNPQPLTILHSLKSHASQKNDLPHSFIKTFISVAKINYDKEHKLITCVIGVMSFYSLQISLALYVGI